MTLAFSMAAGASGSVLGAGAAAGAGAGAGMGLLAALGPIGAVAGVVGTVLSAFGASQQAKIQKIQYQMQADNARTNAALADINGQMAVSTAGRNADMAEALGDFNSSMALKFASINNAIAAGVADLNWSIAEGDYDLILAQGETAAAVAEGNAKILEAAAQNELYIGSRQEQASMLSTAAFKSQQRAAMSASGLTLDSDSNLALLTTTDYYGDVEVATIHQNAVRSAMGYRIQAVDQLNAADSARLNAKAEALSSKAQAMGAKISSDIGILNTTMSANFDALQTRTNAKITAINYRNQGAQANLNAKISALGYSSQATAATLGAASTSPFLAGATSLLAGASDVAKSWYSYKKAA